jgi:tRNA nucleotidyltransferase/poly(A) polymerase
MENKKIRLEVRKILMESEMKEIRLKFSIPIPQGILTIKDLVQQKGNKLFLVGGAVRDALLGKTPKDFDLVTDAKPDMVIQIFSDMFGIKEVLKNPKGEIEAYILKNGYRLNLQGKQFGVVAVFNIAGLPEGVEIATFRKDIGSGRRPGSVEFTDIYQDARRRDLTVNALYYDIDSGEVIDLVGGIEDLKNGIVRTVGSAEERFKEDRLRILRAIRFAGRFGSELDTDTDLALKKDANLEGVSGERIRDEFLKGIKSAKSVKHFLQMLEKYNLFDWIFPGLKVDESYIYRMQGDYSYNDYIVLLSHLLKGNTIDSLRAILNGLKYSADEIKSICFLISLLKLDINTAVVFKKAQKTSGVSDDQIRNFGANEGIMSQLLDAFEEFKFTVNAQDLMSQGFSGKELGEEKDRLETANFEKLLYRN